MGGELSNNMGFKYNDKAIRCPIFKRVVKTTNGKFVGVVCTECRFDLGFKADPCIRFADMQELNDFVELFCADCFERCPYYTVYSKRDGG